MKSASLTRARHACLALAGAWLLFCTVGASRSAAEGNVPSFALTAGWDSLYVSEGRDNLDGDSLATASAGIEFGPFFADVWWGEGQEIGF